MFVSHQVVVVVVAAAGGRGQGNTGHWGDGGRGGSPMGEGWREERDGDSESCLSSPVARKEETARLVNHMQPQCCTGVCGVH